MRVPEDIRIPVMVFALLAALLGGLSLVFLVLLPG